MGQYTQAWERWGGEALLIVLELRKCLADIDNLITTSVFWTSQDQMMSGEKSLYSLCENYAHSRNNVFLWILMEDQTRKLVCVGYILYKV